MTKKNNCKKVNKQQMKVNHKIMKKVVETVFSELKKVIVTKKFTFTIHLQSCVSKNVLFNKTNKMIRPKIFFDQII